MTRRPDPQDDPTPDDLAPVDGSSVSLEDEGVGPVEEAPIDVVSPKVECDERGVIKSGRLKGLTMWGAIFVLAWPVLLESFLNALVGMVDTILAARISTAATDAIGVASYFQWFIGMLTIALGVGATALISRAVGRGRTAFAGVVFGQVVTIGSIMGVLTGTALFLLSPQIALLLRLEPGTESYIHTVDYMRIVSLGVPAVTVLFGGISCCRGVGNAVGPMWVMIVINVINVVTSFVLSGTAISYTKPGAEAPLFTIAPVLADGGFGVRGIALGTLIAWNVGGLIIVAMMLRGISGVRLRLPRLRPHASTIARLVRIGTPNFFETAGMWLGNFIVFWFLSAAALEGLYGAHIVAIRVEAFSFMPGFAMSIAAATLAGQYLGAKRPDLARAAILRCTCIAAAIMGGLGAAFVLVPDFIVSVFSGQELHRAFVPPLLIICGFAQVPFAIAIVIRGALRGAGDTRAVMFMTWLMVWGVRLPLAWLGSGVDIPLWGDVVITNPAPLEALVAGTVYQPFWDACGVLVGLWVGLCTELLLRPVPFIVRYVRGKWALVRV